MSSQRENDLSEVSHQIQSLREEIHQLQKTVERLSRFDRETLVPVRKIVDAENTLPDSYHGMRKWLRRHGIPMRTRTGKPKEKGSKARSYVSMKEVRAEESDTTRAAS